MSDEQAERLERLEAAEAARNTFARYADVVDATDLDALGRLFAADATLDAGGRTYTGRDEVLGFYRTAFADDPTRKSHFLTNVATSWLGDGRVAARARLLYTASGPDASLLGWGSYEAVVASGAGEPELVHLAISVHRVSDVRVGWAGVP